MQHTDIHADSSLFSYTTNIKSNATGDTVIVYFSKTNQSDSITYILCDSASLKPADLHKKIFYVQVPVQRVAALSTTEIACIHEIAETESIIASCDIFRITNPIIHERFAQGLIADLGSSMNENREKVMLVRPDVIIKTLFSTQEIQKDAILIQQGIPVIYINNWLENTPLGRTEWIKFIGLLYGEYARADSIFRIIESHYDSLKTLVATKPQKPKVLAGDMLKDIWYLPGGKSYLAHFIRDAGGDYVYSQSEEYGSAPVNIENVIEYAKHATIWVGADSRTKQEIRDKNYLFNHFHILDSGSVYHYKKRSNAAGGNDYWESGIVRADYVLADFIKIFHTDVLPNYELKYFGKVE